MGRRPPARATGDDLPVATSTPRAPRALHDGHGPGDDRGAQTYAGALRASAQGRRAELAGTLALAGIAASIWLIPLGPAAAPSSVVPRSSGRFFPAWLSRPLHAIAFRASSSALVAIVLLACACYAVVLRCVPAI